MDWPRRVRKVSKVCNVEPGDVFIKAMGRVRIPWVTAGHSPFLLALAPDFRLNPVKRLIPAARGGEIAIPCQPRAAPKAVVLWSKGTEILVNSSRYNPYSTRLNSCSSSSTLKASPLPAMTTL